ncbi:MAG: methyltransferase domain-containing protein [Chlorobi bacterium]|nr:methyltransferase domain-containing protein [Chlorobiota bacterium]
MNQNGNKTNVPPVWLYALLTTFRNFLKKLYFKMVPPGVAVFEKATSIWMSKALGVACELNLADMIGDGEMSIDELARKSGTNPVALYRMMRLLAGECVFRETGDRVFANTRMSKAMMEGDNSIKQIIMQHVSEVNFDLANVMEKSVRTGKNMAFDELGMDVFTYLETHPEKNELYNKAMSNTSQMLGTALLSAYHFKNIKTLVDLGGGEGTLLFQILQKYKDMKGIVFDFPHVVKTARETARRFGVEDRIQVEEGNFFEKMPPGDAYLLKNVLHIFDDDRSIKLLKNIYKSMPAKGKVLIVEAVIKSDNKPALGKIIDMQMLIGTETGRERTEKEYKALVEAAGFTFRKAVHTVSPFGIIEAIKN